MYRLVFLTGKMKGRRLAVQQGSLLIGRDPECQLDLTDDDEVSRHHALIEQRPDGIYIKDLGATNPTEINGRAVKEWKLKPGDKIEIGRTVMQFQLIESSYAGTRRRSSPLQWIAFAAMAAILLGQLAYWILFPMWHGGGTPAPAPAVGHAESPPLARKAVEPKPAPTHPAAQEARKDDLQSELEQAVARAEAESSRSTTSRIESATDATPDQMLSQVESLRQDLVELRKQVEVISAVTSAPPAGPSSTLPPAKEPMPPPVPAPPQPTPEKPNEDVLLVKAREMLTEALVEAQRSNLIQADALMERVQIMAPDFVPAYVERARLYESRGMLKKAGEQWTQVMNRTMGSPLYEQAAAERQRLARAEIIMTMTRNEPSTPSAAAGTRLPRRIRIVSIEREKFEANRDYDEMRIVRVALKPRPSEGDIDTSDFAVVFTFYDKGLTSGTVAPTGAVVPEEPARVEGVWRASQQKTATAAYLLPKGFRVDESEERGERFAFEGVRIQVYYKDELQDEDAVPKSLLALESPPPPSARSANQPVRR